jgi:hypothetical protein
MRKLLRFSALLLPLTLALLGGCQVLGEPQAFGGAPGSAETRADSSSSENLSNTGTSSSGSVASGVGAAGARQLSGGLGSSTKD